MIDIVPLVARDVHHVLDHPWAVTSDELASFNLAPSDSWRVVERLWLDSSHAYGLRLANEPVAIMGGTPTDDGLYWTWFLASERFPEVGRDVTRAVRSFLKVVRQQYPDVRVVCASGSQRADAGDWFRLLGFRRAPDYDYNRGGRLFVGYQLKE